MKNIKKDVNVQQLTVGAGYMAGENERGRAGAWGAAKDIGVVATGVLLTCSIKNMWNPLGWGGYAATIVVGA